MTKTRKAKVEQAPPPPETLDERSARWAREDKEAAHAAREERSRLRLSMLAANADPGNTLVCVLTGDAQLDPAINPQFADLLHPGLKNRFRAMGADLTERELAEPAREKGFPAESSRRAVVVAKTEKTETTEGDKGGRQYKLFGFPVTHVLRWMGADGWPKQDALKVLAALGLDVKTATVEAQLPAGRKKPGDKAYRGEPAALTEGQEEELRSILKKAGG